MRTVAEIPHDLFKITVFSWNARYIIKFELDIYEQVYKVSENDISGLDSVKKLIDEQMLDDVFQNFLSMRNGFSGTIKRNQDNF